VVVIVMMELVVIVVLTETVWVFEFCEAADVGMWL
jgi:hypothetical protein